MREVKKTARVIVKYDGYTVSQNGKVDLKFKIAYDELMNLVDMFAMLNNNVELYATQAPKQKVKLGEFQIKGANVGGDGETKLVFVTIQSFAEMDELNNLSNEKDSPGIILDAIAIIELEDEYEQQALETDDWPDDDNEGWDDDDENNREDWD